MRYITCSRKIASASKLVKICYSEKTINPQSQWAKNMCVMHNGPRSKLVVAESVKSKNGIRRINSFEIKRIILKHMYWIY